jgi:hypothetical protein
VICQYPVEQAALDRLYRIGEVKRLAAQKQQRPGALAALARIARATLGSGRHHRLSFHRGPLPSGEHAGSLRSRLSSTAHRNRPKLQWRTTARSHRMQATIPIAEREPDAAATVSARHR